LLRDSERYAPIVKAVMWWGLLIGLCGTGVILSVRIWFAQPEPFVTLLNRLAFVITPLALASFYAGGVLMLAQIPKWRARLNPFGAVGRMALTNYLVQSLFFTWFFRLTHTFGSVGPAWGLVPTVIFFAIQIWFSVWWLKHYQFGPAEWMWRSLTYGTWQPMRRLDQHLLNHIPGYIG
jgi:uncharacterized protein